ncbi:MAG: hypothetical protein ACRC30_11205 [Clostridium sp.]
MFSKQTKSMKLSDYFEVRKPSYLYIKIIPHKSIRNYTSVNIAKAIANTYKGLNKRIEKANKKLIFEMEYKISYLIDISVEDTGFYLVVPKFFKSLALEKIHEVWSQATVEIIEDGIKGFTKKAECYSLSYKKHDGLSLKIDKKTNDPLNSILSVMDIMKEEDRILLAYNFIPRSQFGWSETYDDLETKVKKKIGLDKPVLNFEYIFKNATLTVIKAIDLIVEVLNDFFGGITGETKATMYESMFRLLEKQNDISDSNYKKTSQVIDTQIAVISESIDINRKVNNALSICQAFRALDGDNELKYKNIKNTVNIEDYSFKNCKTSVMSTDEVGQLIQMPGRSLLNSLGINYIKTEETKVPEKLKEGIKRLGDSKYKGSITPAYLEDEYNIGNLPLVAIGSQGGGKTTYMANYVKDCIDNNEACIIIDFIKNCELSNDIMQVVPKDKIVEVDLADEKMIQGLGFNEIKITSKMSAFEKLKYANIQTQQLMDLVDSISVGDPLSSRMRRFLQATGDVVFSLGYNSIKDVVNCLENHKYRIKFINQLDSELKSILVDEINTLQELNEYSKVTAKEQKEGIVSEIVGTKESKIEHILDRVAMLRSDFKLKYMFNKSLENNIDLVECMEQNKVVFFKMKQDEFPSKMVKNILVTYLVSKVWLSCEIRGKLHEKPNRCNTIIDEVFQAPTTMGKLEYILPQSRKFGCKFVFSTQYIRQLEKIFDTLEASGSSYMLLKGCLEDDFNHFKSKLTDFEFEDLRAMEQYSSLNLIYYSEGYSSFITKLPKPIKQESV